MLQLVYASRETSPFSEDGLLALLQKSRANNQKLGVTGMLVYQDGCFLQVLEGSPTAVRGLYERIARDPRHADAHTIHEVLTDRRDFPDWTMGFRNLNFIEDLAIPGVNRFLQSGISAASFAADPPRAKALLLAFKARGEEPLALRAG